MNKYEDLHKTSENKGTRYSTQFVRRNKEKFTIKSNMR